MNNTHTFNGTYSYNKYSGRYDVRIPLHDVGTVLYNVEVRTKNNDTHTRNIRVARNWKCYSFCEII